MKSFFSYLFAHKVQECYDNQKYEKKENGSHGPDHSLGGKRYHSLDRALRSTYGEKVYKITLNAG